MSQFRAYSLSGYHFFCRPNLVEPDFSQMIALLNQPYSHQTSPLGGRGNVQYVDLNGLGKVVIKSYCRGGLLGLLVRRYYLRLGQIRSKNEFEMLEQVRSCGVQAPEPLLYIYSGNLFYRTWLVTREVENKQTLLEVALRDEDRARESLQPLVDQIMCLVRNRIFHVDLHPGNVLLDQNGNTFLVDFDKACIFEGSPEKLRDLYLFRWRRAVIKHNLPEFLAELVSLGLRKVSALAA